MLVSNVYSMGSGHFVMKYQPNLCSLRFCRWCGLVLLRVASNRASAISDVSQTSPSMVSSSYVNDTSYSLKLLHQLILPIINRIR